jgi:hypothetical protein
MINWICPRAGLTQYWKTLAVPVLPAKVLQSCQRASRPHGQTEALSKGSEPNEPSPTSGNRARATSWSADNITHHTLSEGVPPPSPVQVGGRDGVGKVRRGELREGPRSRNRQ